MTPRKKKRKSATGKIDLTCEDKLPKPIPCPSISSLVTDSEGMVVRVVIVEAHA